MSQLAVWQIKEASNIYFLMQAGFVTTIKADVGLWLYGLYPQGCLQGLIYSMDLKRWKPKLAVDLWLVLPVIGFKPLQVDSTKFETLYPNHSATPPVWMGELFFTVSNILFQLKVFLHPVLIQTV